MFKNEYKIIKKSGFFDKKYYLENYDDVKKSNIDPLKHFIENGWKEGRNPSRKFNTIYYLQTYNDVKNTQNNPLVHFIMYGKKEGRNPFDGASINKKETKIKKLIKIIKHAKNNPQLINRTIAEIKIYGIKKTIQKIKDKYKKIEETSYNNEEIKDFDELMNLFSEEVIIPNFKISKPIDIIIPVYNGLEFLEPLINSIIKNTSMNYQIFMCDDKSSDGRVLPLLKKLKDSNPSVNITLLENEQNLGFIKTVNKLVKYTNNHFVLLNTDTELPPYWIERLMYPIFEMNNIASTTPFTNAGTICSFPNYLEDNSIFEDMNVEELDSYFQYVNFEKTFIEIPTGVGFCMGVNKTLVNKIGMFDEIFGKGYGEENDWCQRAIKKGYKNLHVTNLFVYHKHGGSFPSEQKKKLIERNSIVLLKKFPNYNSDVSQLILRNELESLRKIIILKIIANNYDKKLFVSHSFGGGADEYINSYLNSDSIIFKFIYDPLSSYRIEILIKGKESYKFSIKNYQFLSKLIEEFNFKDIYINNLVSYPKVLDLIKYLLLIKKEFNLNYTYLLHDYYCICPMYNLLNYKIEFCNIPEDENECKKCLSINPLIKKQVNYILSDYPNLDINTWRRNFTTLLNVSDNIIVFSNDSKNLLIKAYPILKDKNILSSPHLVNWVEKIEIPSFSKILKIAVIGMLTVHKGYNVISSLATYIDYLKLDVEIHIFGEIIEPYETISLCNCIKVHGRYNKLELSDLIKDNNINMIIVPSICPETFSYTTQEAINMGLDIACFDLGAPAERLKKYDKSLILNDFESKYIIKEIFKYFDMDLNEIIKKESKFMKTRVTFVCVSNNDLIYKSHLLSSYYITKYPIIKYNNIENNLPVPLRYNNAISTLKTANYDGWIFFIHNDFSILEDVSSIVKDLDKNSIYGSIGAILKNDKKYLYGEILQGHDNKLTKHGIKIDKPTKVDTVDCQCIFFHSDLINEYDLLFDEDVVLDFHQYTEEFCLNAKKSHNINTYAVPFLCKHTSWGTLNAGYYKAEKYLISKFGKNWAGTCTHL